MPKQVCKHVYISGRVQGVGFRAFTVKTAQKMNLTGWVKNLSDGRVEAVFSGRQEDVEEILEAVHEGPSFARVDDVEVIDETYDGKYNGFEVKY
ncbi:MAG: acylphosphatase [Bacillota bacterium]